MKLVTLLCIALTGTAAYAQSDYPKRPVRLVLSFGAPGGAPDTIARTIAPKLSEMWGQQLVVDPRQGAGGIVGTEIAAKSAPDGYTLVLVSPSHAINPALHSKMPYDSVRDFTPVTQLAQTPNILLANPSVPARSVKELVALAKGKPGTLSYGSAGVGSSQHLAGELFKEMAGVNLVHVPYKAASATNVDLIAGRIQLAFGSVAAIPHVRSGKLVALGTATARRSSALPDVPTIAEAGVPGYEAAAWYGVLAPAGTPRAIVAKLHDDFKRAAQSPDVRSSKARWASKALSPKVLPLSARSSSASGPNGRRW